MNLLDDFLQFAFVLVEGELRDDKLLGLFWGLGLLVIGVFEEFQCVQRWLDLGVGFRLGLFGLFGRSGFL